MDQPNKRNIFDPEQARSLRKHERMPNRNTEEDEIDQEFHDKPDRAIERNKKDLKNKNIKNQIEYFGYILEPFNMNNEKKIGVIDDDGFFVFDKQKEKDVSDPWLDGLDQDPYNQGLEQTAQNSIDQKKNKIDVSKEDFNEMQSKTGEFKQHEKISSKNLVELVEKLIENLAPNQTPNQLIKTLKPIPQKQHVYKKNIRKTHKTQSTNNKNEEIDEENNNEKLELFKEIVEICDVISSNGYLDIYSQKKEELIIFLNEKLKKNNNIGDNLIDSDTEFKLNDDDSNESSEEEDKK